MRTRFFVIAFAMTNSILLFADDLPPALDRQVEFAVDVQPILSKHCLSCHGSEKQEAGLRLDRSDLAMLGGDSGKAIVAGDSAKSRLIHYVAATDSEKVMPPEGQRLSPKEISVLRTWIDRGAVWPDDKSANSTQKNHWAYQPLKSHSLPEVIRSNWVINPIDRFILAKLESQGIAPSPEANRFTLIRRLSLDLIGLLPSVEEVDAFVTDSRPNAYETLVDRLLDSPHFGERWGRHWLDMARYADSDGYEKDNPRPDAYRWRDWVIDAINADMPFDQFTIDQLAGDLLPNATPMQRLATAFHRQTLTNTEGGADQEQFRVEACFDRTETTGAVWLGLTVGCARCHSHKYDAISQREYYQLFAFYNNGDEQTLVVPKSEEEIKHYQQSKASHDAAMAELTGELRKAQLGILPTLSIWEEEIKKQISRSSENPIQREPLLSPQATSDGEVIFTSVSDGSFLANGPNPEVATYTIQGQTTGVAFDTVRLDVLADKSLPAKGPGRVSHGNFVLSEISIETSETEDFTNLRRLKFDAAKADHEQSDRPWLAKHAIDGDDKTGWAIANKYGKDHWAEFHLKEALPANKPLYVRIRLSHQYGKQHAIGRFKVSMQTGRDAPVDVPKNIAKILTRPADDRNEAQRKELLDHFSGIDPSTKQLVEKLAALAKKEPAKPEQSVRVIGQRTKEPRKTFVLRRGEFLEPIVEADVKPSGLSSLPALSPRNADESGDRLDLARWLVSLENPITPRVTVNHVWRTLFGTGIVKTANDFGVRGDAPTHPELLDWLARDFIGLNAQDDAAGSRGRTAWSRKALIKQIAMSATYRQASKRRTDLLEIDPQNQLLASQNRMRVEGEIVRDITLDAAGLLARKIGGPSVFPSLPPGIAELSYAGNFKWTVSSDMDRYRRGMYTFFKRTAPHPNLITFDCPDANLACVDRNKSNTPLQALVGLNNESFAESAQALAKRVLSNENLDAKSRLETAFRICVARPLSERDLVDLLALLDASRSWYADHPDQAKALVGNFIVPSTTIQENAAWIATARVLINLDEFITRE